MNVAVIGAGMAGICAAKNALAFGYKVTVFEQTDNIGGTWVYTEETDKDKYGLNIHSSMYSQLRTNLPKEMMGFPDFPFAPNERNSKVSFVTSNDVLEFIQSYAKEFKIESHIKFHQHVIRIRPKVIDQKTNAEYWEIIVKDLQTNIVSTSHFDAVMICSGHFFDPKIPELPGQDIFKGKQLHSHVYRRPDSLKGENVLIVGSGPSGMDIGRKIAPVVQKVTLSQRAKGDHSNVKTLLTKWYPVKDDVVRLTENGAIFADGSSEEFSTILYATGYNNTFPFLSMECEITVDDNCVHPLYQQVINVNHPTMCIIGLPTQVSPSHIFDIQCRFFLQYLSGKAILPTREEMLNVTNFELKTLWDKGTPKWNAHLIGPSEQKNYCDKLANLAGITAVPDVIHNMLIEIIRLAYSGSNVAAMKFNIIDDKTFEVV